MMPAAESWFAGAGIVWGSTLVAAADGNSSWLVGIGAAIGMGFAIVGGILDKEKKRMRDSLDRQDDRIGKLESMIDQKNQQITMAEDVIRQLRCPYAEGGKARCHDEDKREVPVVQL
jgi:hypothetical protein